MMLSTFSYIFDHQLSFMKCQFKCLCIINRSSLLDIFIINIFCHSVNCLFNNLNGVFLWIKVLNSNKSNLSIFSFKDYASCTLLKESLLALGHVVILLTQSSSSVHVSLWHSSLRAIWNWFYVCCEVGVKTHPQYGYSIDLVPFIDKTIFPNYTAVDIFAEYRIICRWW